MNGTKLLSAEKCIYQNFASQENIQVQLYITYTVDANCIIYKYGNNNKPASTILYILSAYLSIPYINTGHVKTQ